MIKQVHGNLLTAKEDIIVHQCNCLGSMGAGVALSIKKEWPIVYDKYKVACKTIEPKDLLGKIQMLKVDNNKYICNMFSQLEYGRNKVQTDYKAMEKCLYKIYEYAKDKNLNVAMPYKIGCGLAGGDWNIVYSLLNKIFIDVNLTLYKL